MKPDRVVIGTDNVRTAEIMKELYDPFMRKQNRMIVMDIRSAEMTKYAANAMLATRISFMNQIAGLCDCMGADVASVREGIGSDTRIGYDFLFPGPGYGGSCFPKDVKALIKTAEECNYDFLLLKGVEEVNERQKEVLANKLIKALGSPAEEQPLTGRTIACWQQAALSAPTIPRPSTKPKRCSVTASSTAATSMTSWPMPMPWWSSPTGANTAIRILTASRQP